MSIIIFSGGLHEKDPSDSLVYAFDWDYYEPLGEGVEIASVVHTVTGLVYDTETEEWVSDDNLVIGDESFSADDRITYVQLSGGTLNAIYTVSCRATSNETIPQTMERSFRVYVRQR